LGIFIRLLTLPALVLAVRINGAADDHDKGDDEGDDRAHVRLAAVVFVGSAADVVLAHGFLIYINYIPVPPPVLNLLREARASGFTLFFIAHVVAGGGAGRGEGDVCEEVPRHGAARLRQPFRARRGAN
jgi:hypothetical protein